MAKRRGPPPKPTVLKLIEGNPGKRKLNSREPRPRPARPPCPKELDAGARKEWRRIVRELDEFGLLTNLDRAALAGYCQAWSDWLDAREKIAKYGKLTKGAKGNLVKSPVVRLADDALTHLRALAAEFGFTPSSRTRVAMPPERRKSLRELLA